MTKSAFRCVQIVLLFYGVFGADEDEVKAVSVMEGDSVTLNPDLTQIKKFNQIEWRFRGPIIAQTDGNDISYPPHTEIFRDRLQLDLTGSLTIKNMKTKHSGLYELKISHGAGTAERKFSVTVYESPSDPGESEMKSLSVKEGDRVTLQTDVTLLSGEELVVWRFGDEGKVIAKADIEAKSSPLYYDGRFRDRLELERDQTGSLIITNTRSTDSGFYTVKISSNKQTVHKRFSVSVSEPGLSPGGKAGIVVAVLLVLAAAAAGFIYYRRKISELQKQIVRDVLVTEGESVHLFTDHPKIERDDVIQWMFEDEIIAEIKGGTGKTHDDRAAGRFRDRLELNDRTGDLTIKNSTAEDAGRYKLKISSSKGNRNWTYVVIIRGKRVSVTEGESVHLSTNLPKIERDDEIQWRFEDEIIAEIKEGTGETHDDRAAGRFRDRLQLNDQTGDLTIKSFTDKDAGRYKLKISSSKGNTNWTYGVIIPVKRVSVTEGESVHLSTNLPKIERGDVIQWRCGDEIIAEIKEGTGETHDDRADKRFRDRLQLNDQTGDLTIKNSTAKDEGDYKLNICSRKGNTNRTYSVIITGRDVFVTAGESVHLHTDRPKIERDAAVTDAVKPREKSPVKGNNDESVVEMQSLLDE